MSAAAGITNVAIALVGPGLIGGTLLDQISKQTAVLLRTQNLVLTVVGILSSKKMLLRNSSVSLANWREAFAKESEPADVERFTSHLSSHSPAKHPVLVDCTANDDVAARYVGWLSSGIHVVTPNKKLNSGPLERYNAVMKLQQEKGVHYFSEGSVGAGLPILSTLNTLVGTGDSILKVEGILSGTLSYIFNSYGKGVAFSDVVTQAKAQGYTEPDPRDDLEGTDVARKVLTLARLCGAQLELEDVAVHSLVPQPLRSVATAEEFLQKLPEYDAELEARAASAESLGQVLRYVGSYDAASGACTAALQAFPQGHPFSQLSGSDNMVVITTQRYNRQPLIILGPGAGADVTAAGVFGDILSLAKCLPPQS